MTSPALLTEDEAAEALRVCARTLRKERQSGKLPYILIGRRVLYSQTDIETFIERARMVTAPRPKQTGAAKVGANHKTGNIIPLSQRRRAGR